MLFYYPLSPSPTTRSYKFIKGKKQNKQSWKLLTEGNHFQMVLCEKHSQEIGVTVSQNYSIYLFPEHWCTLKFSKSASLQTVAKLQRCNNTARSWCCNRRSQYAKQLSWQTTSQRETHEKQNLFIHLDSVSCVEVQDTSHLQMLKSSPCMRETLQSSPGKQK